MTSSIPISPRVETPAVAVKITWKSFKLFKTTVAFFQPEPWSFDLAQILLLGTPYSVAMAADKEPIPLPFMLYQKVMEQVVVGDRVADASDALSPFERVETSI